MKIEHIQTFNWEGAIRGMRNPMKSWDKIDSDFITVQGVEQPELGEKDKELCMKLIKAGGEHRKFLRQIFISFDLTAPDYFWKEYETYQIGVTENSTSTMHTLMKRDLTIEDFEFDGECGAEFEVDFFYSIINEINHQRNIYLKLDNEKHKKMVWRYIIQILPMSFLYTRTCTMNYEVLINIYHQRKNHKLKEWQIFLNNMLLSIPYPEFITEK